MNKSWQVVFAFIVVFLAGGAIGAVFTLRYLTPPLPPRGVDSVQRVKPEEFGPAMIRRWMNSSQLGLTQAQREKIRPIIFDTAEDLQRAQIERTHDYVLLLEHMQDEIAAILTAPQRDKFYQMIQNQRNAMTQRERQRRAMQAAGPEAAPSASP